MRLLSVVTRCLVQNIAYDRSIINRHINSNTKKHQHSTIATSRSTRTSPHKAKQSNHGTTLSVDLLKLPLVALALCGMPSRDRYSGGVDGLFHALEPVVGAMGTQGKSFIKYDEAEHASASKVDVEHIMRAGDVLVAMRGCHAKLCFRRSDMSNAASQKFGEFCEG